MWERHLSTHPRSLAINPATGGYFDEALSMTLPARSLAERPWPSIVAADLNHALSVRQHMVDLAVRHSISVKVAPPGGNEQSAAYLPAVRTIFIHPDAANDPLAVAFMLAHELAHAFDPVGPRIVHHFSTDSKAVAEAEIVAEAAAVNTLRRLGCEVQGEDAYLDQFDWVQFNGGWEKSLDPGRKLHDRYRAAMLSLGDAVLAPTAASAEMARILRRADSEVAQREAAFRSSGR